MASLGFWAPLAARARSGGGHITALAPMAAVTDVSFRSMIAEYGRPDVLWTEFVSADGLTATPEGARRLARTLRFTPAERPVVAQLFGHDPDRFERACAMVAELGFDGVDINMGCPDSSVSGRKQLSGAALIRHPDAAQELVRAAKRGVAGALPVSVKTRTGYAEDAVAEWIPRLLEVEPAALTLHGRTRQDMSAVPARWEVIAAAGDIVRAAGLGTVFLGNGDVQSLEQGRELSARFGTDGVMIGRAIFGNPWVFTGRDPADVPLHERLVALLDHTARFAHYAQPLRRRRPRWRGRPSGGGDTGGDTHAAAAAAAAAVAAPAAEGADVQDTEHADAAREAAGLFAPMRKNYRCYASGFGGAKALRDQLVRSSTPLEVAAIVEAFARGSGLDLGLELELDLEAGGREAAQRGLRVGPAPQAGAGVAGDGAGAGAGGVAPMPMPRSVEQALERVRESAAEWPTHTQ